MITVGPAPGIPADGFVDVSALEDLPQGSQKSIQWGFERILLCHTAEGIHAVADLCPHALQPLMGSTVAGGAIRCAKHGAEFDLVTGKPRNGVTPRTLKIYPLKVEQGRILVGAAPGVRRPATPLGVTAPGDAATTPGAKPVAGS